MSGTSRRDVEDDNRQYSVERERFFLTTQRKLPIHFYEFEEGFIVMLGTRTGIRVRHVADIFRSLQDFRSRWDSEFLVLAGTPMARSFFEHHVPGIKLSGEISYELAASRLSKFRMDNSILEAAARNRMKTSVAANKDIFALWESAVDASRTNTLANPK